jgi:hypothetical protein
MWQSERSGAWKKAYLAQLVFGVQYGVISALAVTLGQLG